jgi:hypothetical protein
VGAVGAVGRVVQFRGVSQARFVEKFSKLRTLTITQ